MKIGIIGGTFNPPHIGHLIIGEDVREKLKLDKVFFIPANIPPHKETDNNSAHHRLQMLNLAVSDNEYFSVIDWEIQRGGISWTIDTMKLLKTKNPFDKFYLIVGSDLVNSFSSWKNFEELKKITDIVVAYRKDYPFKTDDKFITVDIIQVDISSSRIRERVNKNYSIKYLVKDSVAEYIYKHKLYC